MLIFNTDHIHVLEILCNRELYLSKYVKNVSNDTPVIIKNGLKENIFTNQRVISSERKELKWESDKPQEPVNVACLFCTESPCTWFVPTGTKVKNEKNIYYGLKGMYCSRLCASIANEEYLRERKQLQNPHFENYVLDKHQLKPFKKLYEPIPKTLTRASLSIFGGEYDMAKYRDIKNVFE